MPNLKSRVVDKFTSQVEIYLSTDYLNIRMYIVIGDVSFHKKENDSMITFLKCPIMKIMIAFILGNLLRDKYSKAIVRF